MVKSIITNAIRSSQLARGNNVLNGLIINLLNEIFEMYKFKAILKKTHRHKKYFSVLFFL